MSTRADQPEPDFADLSARVYRLCIAMLGGRAGARDAAQESLARAWSRRSRKRADVSWWVWTAGFAVRVCREARRSRSIAQDCLKEGCALRTAGAESSLRFENSIDARFGALHEAVMALPDRQREVIILRFLLDMPVAKAAEVLDCPQGTVKSNLHKAIAALKGAFKMSESSDELRAL